MHCYHASFMCLRRDISKFKKAFAKAAPSRSVKDDTPPNCVITNISAGRTSATDTMTVSTADMAVGDVIDFLSLPQDVPWHGRSGLLTEAEGANQVFLACDGTGNFACAPANGCSPVVPVRVLGRSVIEFDDFRKANDFHAVFERAKAMLAFPLPKGAKANGQETAKAKKAAKGKPR